ncbi:MAG: type II secretion system protein [Planctomycetota bacterium]
MSTPKPWQYEPRHSRAGRAGRLATNPRARRGFTLIELLVVVAIIAMLISILLPSLQGAREQARAAVCGQRLHGIANGLHAYTTENSDWLPGYNTSGVRIRALRLSWNGAPQVLFQSSLPVQSWDWHTPLLTGEMELPSLRSKRFKLLLDEFRCPSQRFNSILYPGGLSASPDSQNFEDEGIWPAVSYLMPAHFQFVGQEQGGRLLGYMDNPSVSIPIFARSAPDDWEVVTEDYLPQITRVGAEARKIFVADGTRYLDVSQLLDHDVSPDPNWFGSFTSSGAWWAGSTAYGVKRGTPNWDGSPVSDGSPCDGQNLSLSYRHGSQLAGSSGDAHSNGGSINALFFDGHTERLSDKESRDAHLWYPTGSIVKKPSEGMTNLPLDFVIP